MGWRDRIAQALFGDVIDARVQEAVKVIDDKWWSQISGALGPHDVDWHERQGQLKDALEAWRENPLAFRVVALKTDYVVGSGISGSTRRGSVVTISTVRPSSSGIFSNSSKPPGVRRWSVT